MSFSGPSQHRCKCFGEGDGPNGTYYPCPPELCEAEALLARAEAAEAELQRLREGLREQGEPIMDERFRDRLLRHVLSNEEVGQLVDAIESRERRARALLADSSERGWGEVSGDRLARERLVQALNHEIRTVDSVLNTEAAEAIVERWDALVEIAKAAREAAHPLTRDGYAAPFMYHPANEKLRSALARLDSGATEGDA